VHGLGLRRTACADIGQKRETEVPLPHDAGQDGHARPRIEQAAAAFGATLDERTREDIAVWLQLLQQWNARIDLTAARSDDELVDLMLADAFFLARACRPTPAWSTWARAQAPGARPRAPAARSARDLVEPLGKRARSCAR